MFTLKMLVLYGKKKSPWKIFLVGFQNLALISWYESEKYGMYDFVISKLSARFLENYLS